MSALQAFGASVTEAARAAFVFKTLEWWHTRLDRLMRQPYEAAARMYPIHYRGAFAYQWEKEPDVWKDPPPLGRFATDCR